VGASASAVVDMGRLLGGPRARQEFLVVEVDRL